MELSKKLGIAWNHFSNILFNPACQIGFKPHPEGDLKHAAFDPSKFVDLLRKDSSKYYSVRYLGNFEERNRVLSAPLLLSYINSADSSTAKEYQTNRSIQFSHLPSWGQEMIRELVWDRYNSFDPFDRKYNPTLHSTLKKQEQGIVSAFRQQINDYRNRELIERSAEKDLHISTLGLEAFATLPHFQKFITAAEGLRYSELIIRQHFIPQATEFTIGNYGPLGIIALKTIKEAVPLMFTIQLINDCTKNLDLTLEPADLKAWAKEFTNRPWKFCESKGFNNILVLRSFIQDNKISVTADDLKKLAKECFLRKDLPKFLREFFPTYVVAPQEHPEIKSDIYAELKSGLNAAVTQYFSELKPSEIKHWSRKLFLAVRKTSIEYTDVLERLQAGNSPEQIYNQAYVDILSNSRISSLSASKRTNKFGSEAPAGESDSKKVVSKPINSYQLKFHFKFSDLKLEFEEIVFEKIKKTIDRMKKGHFGHIRYLGDSVLESKLHLLAGYRIYFTILGRDLHLLHVGPKGCQDRNMEYAKKLAKTL